MLLVAIILVFFVLLVALFAYSPGISYIGGLDYANPFDGALTEEPPHWIYYADRRHKWKQYTNEQGAQLLRGLFGVAQIQLDRCKEIIKQRGLSEEDVLTVGEELYGNKPNKAQKGVTWSQREYDDLGLQYYYLRFKSIQRFTEAYNMYTRADSVITTPLLRVVSLGGGPGYELYAATQYTMSKNPSYHPRDFKLTSMDLADWSAYMPDGVSFVHGSFSDDAAVDAIVAQHDYVVFSYVVYHYIKSADLFKRIIPQCKGVFVNERVRFMDIIREIERDPRFTVHYLISDGDCRQVFMTLKSDLHLQRESSVVFEDVPYD